MSCSGDASNATVLAANATVARTLASMASDVVNAAGFGAFTDTPLQAARKVVPNGGTLFLPPGNVTISKAWPSPTASTSSLWLLSGNTGADYFSVDSDVVETFNNGKWLYRFSNNSSAGSEGAVLRVDQIVTNIDGGPGGSSIEGNFSISATANPGQASTGFAFNAKTAATGPSHPMTGFFVSATREVGGTQEVYGLNFEVIDFNAPTATGALIGCEWDIVANGTSLNQQWGGSAYVVAKRVSTGAPCIPQFAISAENTQGDLTQGGWINALQVYSTNIYGAAFDACGATIAAGAAAFKMASGHAIEFSGTFQTDTTPSAARQLRFVAGEGLAYEVDGVGNWKMYVGVTGDLTVSGGVPAADTVKVNGTSAIGFSVSNDGTVGIDCVGGTFSAAAVRIGAGNLIDFSNTNTVTFGLDSSGSLITLSGAALNVSGAVYIEGSLQIGNAYTKGAPTASGYVELIDSTGRITKLLAA